MAGVTAVEDVDFVVFSHVVVDDIREPDGTHRPDLLGGAGTYAAVGATLAAGPRRTGIVSGIGDDFPKPAIRWLESAGIDAGGMPSVDPNTPRTLIRYFEDGEREEKPAFGLEHFAVSEPTFRGLPPKYKQARGLYVFKPIDREFWRELQHYRERTACKVLWEIDAAACSPADRTDVLEQLANVDLLSINETEIRNLFADRPHEGAARYAQYLLSTGVSEVIVRRGSRGATVFSMAGELSASPIPAVVMDPTGAGNAFSGAYLASWVDTASDSAQSLASGMAAAALTIQQYGPPPFDPSTWVHYSAATRNIYSTINS